MGDDLFPTSSGKNKSLTKVMLTYNIKLHSKILMIGNVKVRVEQN